MKLKILAFGVAKEIMNGSSVEIDFHQNDAGQLKKLLEEKYPRLKELRSFMIAVNDEYASPSLPVFESDEIAIIPPVSGG
jgi:molybdopterin converting factor subunit 1